MYMCVYIYIYIYIYTHTCICKRSQLDAKLEDRVFDLKTRAVAPVRYDIEHYRDNRSPGT